MLRMCYLRRQGNASLCDNQRIPFDENAEKFLQIPTKNMQINSSVINVCHFRTDYMQAVWSCSYIKMPDWKLSYDDEIATGFNKRCSLLMTNNCVARLIERKLFQPSNKFSDWI